MNNSSQSELDLRDFYVKCINDYVHFILSFYYLTLSEDQYQEVKDILFAYFLEGKFEGALFSSPEILRNFYNRNGNKLKETNKMEALMITNKMRALVEESRKRNLSKSSSTNENAPAPDLNSPKLTLFQKRQLKAQSTKEALSTFVERHHYDNSSPPPTTLLHKGFGAFNRLSHFREIKTSGQQSNMMVSSNGTEFFKTLKSNKLSKRKQFENECRVYRHLGEKDPSFLQNSTCFVACYSDGILLKNGGLSLYGLLKKKPNSALLKPSLQQFFPKLLQLQLCGVSHDDLHCGNVVGFDRDDLRFIDFGLAKTCQQSPNGDFLERLNTVFREIFFSFARKYGLF